MGGIVLPLVLPHLISAHGTSRTMLILSICFAVLIVPLLPFFKGRLPASRSHASRPAPRSSRDWIGNTSFWVLIIINSLQSFGYFMPLLWIPSASLINSLNPDHECLIMSIPAFASDLHLSYANSTLAVALLNGESNIVSFNHNLTQCLPVNRCLILWCSDYRLPLRHDQPVAPGSNNSYPGINDDVRAMGSPRTHFRRPLSIWYSIRTVRAYLGLSVGHLSLTHSQ